MVQICSIPHSAAAGCSTLGGGATKETSRWNRWRENSKTEISREIKKKKKSLGPSCSSLFDARGAPAKASNRLDRDRCCYSKLQDQMKRLARFAGLAGLQD